MSQTKRYCGWKIVLLGLALGGCLGLTGCMGNYSGQNLPSAYYLNSQVQYYPPGNQFPLTNEAACKRRIRKRRFSSRGRRRKNNGGTIKSTRLPQDCGGDGSWPVGFEPHKFVGRREDVSRIFIDEATM